MDLQIGKLIGGPSGQRGIRAKIYARFISMKMMYRIGFVLLLGAFLLPACQNKGLDPKYLTSAMVVRKTHVDPQNTLDFPDTTRKKETGAPAPAAVSSPSSVYHIIVASYRPSERSGAEQFVDNLKARGYFPQIIESQGRLRISIKSMTTETEAQSEAEKYKKLLRRPDIWVMKSSGDS